ncbi:MAG: helix-turn-helix domain-containing protein [bacterium]
MQLEEVLMNLGLNEKQAKVYLAVLQMGKGSVPAISVKAGTKRPTTYLLLEELRMKGLVMLLPRKAKVLYTANSPEQLLEEQREKQQLIKANMPELMAMFNTKKEKPKVTYYQGGESVVKLYDEIFKEKEIDIFASLGAIPKELLAKAEKHFADIAKNQTRVRELLQSDKESIEYTNRREQGIHQIKFAPKECLFPTDNIIFGNKLAIFSFKDEPMAVVIESSDVAQTYKSMFEIVWNSVK